MVGTVEETETEERDMNSVVVKGMGDGVAKVDKEKGIALDTPEFQDIMVEEEDRISALPDCLLVEILSRLPSTKEAIGTGILSKRWEHLWTWLPTLIFKPHNYHNFSLSNYYSDVNKILSQRRRLKLKKFQAFIYYFCDSSTGFESQFNNWLRYAISCNVEELNISCVDWRVNNFVFDQLFFTSSCFTDLRLEGFTMNPTRAVSWNKLMSLSISDETLNEDVIENILSGSPLLKTLKLDDCYGYRRLNISSKSVKNLVFSRYLDRGPSLSHIIAPNILSLTIQPYCGMRKPVLLNVPSLVEANLDYERSTILESEEEVLKGFILNLSHVKELIIGVSCSKVLSLMEAKGFVTPSNLRIREIYEDTDSDNDQE